MTSLFELQSEAQSFYQNIHGQAADLGFDIKSFSPDHLCFRVQTTREHEAVKSILLASNKILTEAQVRGRPIATFRLTNPLKFGNHTIDLLELPAPKDGFFYKTGFEHVEYVLDEPFESLRARYPTISERFEIRDNFLNPEMVLGLQNSCIKFHYSRLDEVIELESRPHWQKKLVVFDLDGTLIDSIKYIAQTNRILLASFGVPSEVLDQIEVFPSTFHELLCRFNLFSIEPRVFAQQWGEEMAKLDIKLFTGVERVLRDLNLLGIPLAIWTARDRASAINILKTLGISQYFSRIWAFDELYSKPNIEGIRFLAAGRPNNLVLFVGDSKADEEGAARFGCQFVLGPKLFSNLENQEKFLDGIKTS